MGVKRWARKPGPIKNDLVKSVDDQDDLALSAFLDSKRIKLLSRARYSAGPKERAHGKRYWRKLKTKYLKILKGPRGYKRRIIPNSAAIMFRPKPNLIRDALTPNFIETWVPMSRRLTYSTAKILKLSDFSFAKDPNGTLTCLADLATASAKFPDLRLNFADTDCHDVAPYIVLAHLTPALPPIISGGEITDEVRDVIEAVGLRQDLRIGQMGKRRRAPTYIVSPFPLMKRTPPGHFGDRDHLLRPQLKEYVADQFVNTMNDWLRGHELELQPAGEGAFASAIGEALDNAERHGSSAFSQSEGDWSIAGFSKLVFLDGTPLLRCSLAIVSIGDTISQTLGSAAPEIASRIDSYVSKHTPLFKPGQKAEALRCVMALQDGITRVEAATAGRRGGVGFMELVDVLSVLGDNNREDLPSTLTIVSGRSCIQITAPYARGHSDESGMRELWFNDDNDPEQPPSNQHVTTLDNSFPGVILSACFTIDPTILRAKLES